MMRLGLEQSGSQNRAILFPFLAQLDFQGSYYSHGPSNLIRLWAICALPDHFCPDRVTRSALLRQSPRLRSRSACVGETGFSFSCIHNAWSASASNFLPTSWVHFGQQY